MSHEYIKVREQPPVAGVVVAPASSGTAKLLFVLLASVFVVIDLTTVRLNCSIIFLGLLVCYLEMDGRSRALQSSLLVVGLSYLGYFAGARSALTPSYSDLLHSYMMVNRTFVVIGVFLAAQMLRRGATSYGGENAARGASPATAAHRSQDQAAASVGSGLPLLVTCFTLALVVFAIDLLTPLQYNLSILYLSVSVLAVGTRAREYIWQLTFALVLLSILGYLGSPPPSVQPISSIPLNRTLVVLMLLVIATVASRPVPMAWCARRWRTTTALPRVAIIANARTPYRDHVQRRIIAELPQVRLLPVFTHGIPVVEWKMNAQGSREAANFGENDRTLMQHRLRRAPHEWFKAGRVIRHLREQEVSAVVLEGYSDAGRLRIMAWCRRNGVPCFVWGDSNVLGESCGVFRNAVREMLLPRIIRKTNGVLCCGRLGREYYERYGASIANTFYCPYEPDYELIRSIDDKQLAAVRQRFELPADRKYLTFAGRLVSVKGVDLLIDAFTAIARERPDWDLLIIGDGVLREQLSLQVPVALKSRVHWTGFIDEPKTTLSLIRLGDVLVIPSRHEPWGVVVNEAVAAGLAVVASSVVGAAAELVRDHRNGRIFSSNNTLELTEALRDVTDGLRLPAMKTASAMVLAEWRRSADPVRGLCSALQSAGVVE